MKKNTAGQKITVFLFNKTNAEPITGDAANITTTVSKDDAAPAALADINPTELGGGHYSFDTTQEETNAHKIVVLTTSTTANAQAQPLTITTTEPAAGAGTSEVLVNLTDTAAAIVADADITIRATNDSTAAVVTSGQTDAFGNVTFHLEPGTYYRWAQKTGKTFTDPQSFTVT
jgi:hypothetical protein